MPGSSSPLDQSRYQVRLDWGQAGLARLASADVVVIVDVLSWSGDMIDAVTRTEKSADAVARTSEHVVGVAHADEPPVAAASPEEPAGALAISAAGSALVLVGTFSNAAAVADAVLSVQTQRAARTSVAVIPVGGSPAGEAPTGEPRFAVEDLLGAGAIIDALAQLGIDHSSPEAAVASEAFRSLRPALRHLIAACGSGQALAAPGGNTRAAAELNTTEVVPSLTAGTRFSDFPAAHAEGAPLHDGDALERTG